MGPNPSEEQHPPSWGLLPLVEREDHLSGEKDAQMWRAAGLSRFSAGGGSRPVHVTSAPSPPPGDVSESALGAPCVVSG